MWLGERNRRERMKNNGGEGRKCAFKKFFFFKQKTAYEIKECDWSSDVCSSDLLKNTIKFLNGLYKVYEETDASIAEINPLVVTKQDRKSVV